MSTAEDAIAVIGMAGRFPGAPDVAAYWAALLAGTDAVDADAARGLLADPELFDADFFGFSPLEAERTDPQHRLFLECSWLALEHAGHGTRTRPATGVFAGSATSTHLLDVLASERHRAGLDDSQLLIACDKDYLATRVAHRLDLRGPAVVVQSACSTSLVAVHLAVQSLLAGECDLALAGGVCARGARAALGGAAAREDGMSAPDGRCRAFDADASGMVPGDGVGVVVLRRLDDAIADGDRVHAVIRGSAVNNDGAGKAGYTAPSVAGQAAVIRDAWAVAGLDPATAGLVEAHGTGTRLGDPIEVAALVEALGPGADCALGSVKTNIGHLDAAAGVAALIKAVLAVEHGLVPPTVHFSTPNPDLRLPSTRFHVPTSVEPFAGSPRRAGVSSFGIGGTNAHVVVEQAPPVRAAQAAGPQAVLVSARTEAAALAAAAATGAALSEMDDVAFADAAHTLRVGRERFAYRVAVAAGSGAEAARLLAAARPVAAGSAGVAFLLPGQGAQRAGMADGSDDLAAAVDAVAAHGLDIRSALRTGDGLERTDVAQAALFAVGHAAATRWARWGVRPVALLGHSVGEVVAAALAGVLALPDAAALVVARGRAMAQAGPGLMAAVALPADDVAALLPADVEIAAVNAPGQTVVSGPADAVRAALAGIDAKSTELRTAHAFHSAAMDAAARAVTEAAARLPLAAPTIPVLSNVTGTWLTDEQATDPAYWGRQVRATVRFADCVRALAELDPVLLEVGPGRTLADLVAAQGPGAPRVAGGDTALAAACALWAHGVAVDWAAVHPGQRTRAALPGYPFERKPYSVRPAPLPAPAVEERPEPVELSSVEAEVAAAFSRLLGHAEVDRHASFFALGGHSLLGMQLLDALGADLAIADLYNNPTVAQLAALLDSGPDADPDPAPGPEPAGDAPLTPTQERFWLRAQAMPDDTAATVAIAVRLRGPLDRAALAAACAYLPARHSVLRSRFTAVDGVPRQREVEPVLDLRHARAADHAGLLRLAEAEARPFDLAAEPPIRALLAETGPDEHVLLLTLHHIATDAAANAILVEDLAAAYLAGGDPGLPPAPRLADHARALKPSTEDAEHWRALFAAVPPAVDLPADHPPAAGIASARFTTRVDTAALRAYCEQTGTSLFTGLLAAFQTVLHRWTGMPEFLIGTPVTTRASARLVGPLFSTVPVRADLTGDPTFHDLVARVRAAAATSLRHAGTPAERYLPRSPDRAAPYDVLFALQTAPAPSVDLGDLTAEPLELGEGTAQCPLTVSVVPEGDGALLLVDYDANRFTEATATALIGHFAALAAALPAEPDRPVSDVPMLTDAERAALLAAGAAPAPPGPRVVTALVAAQAAATPDAPAVRCGDQALTYRELWDRVEGHASALAALGVTRGDVVGVCVERGIDLVSGVLGVLAAGAAFLPLDPEHPLERRRAALADAGARCLLTGRSPRSWLPDSPVPRIEVTGWLTSPVRTPLPSVRPQDRAYVMYTSGSTGEPKGVAVAHDGVAVDLLWRQAVTGMGPGDRLLHTVSTAFDPSVWQLFGPLVTGAELVMADRHEATDPAAVVRLVREHAITVADFVPSHLARALDHAAPGDLDSLRLVFCGGEKLPRDLADRFHAATRARLRNQYGPTEATIDTTSHLLERGGRGEVAIGGPVHGKRVYVLDRRGEPAPARVTGELWIGGDGLAHGYVGRPAETAALFRPDPLGAPGSRRYRSGDLARFRHDGALEFVGRADQQVKVNGVRIEPAEVAAALRAHPAVAEAAVAVRPVGAAPALVAYVVGGGATARELRAHVAERLPTAFVPAHIVPVDAIPLGPTGKVDTAALPDVAAPARGRLPEPGTAEDAVAALWRELLDRDDVPADVDFFALGGDSLLAVRLLAGLRERFSAELSLPDVLAAGTVEGLVAALAEPGADRPRLARRRTPGAPLSHAQQRVLRLGDPELTRLRLPVPLRGDLDADALDAALSHVVARHEGLRAASDGDHQTPADPYSPLDGAPLDPARGRLLTAELSPLAPDEHLLSLTLHRSAVDGAAVAVLAADLAAAYRAFASGERPRLAPLELHHPDFAAWERSWLTQDAVADAVRRWRAEHPDLPLLDRPRGTARRAVEFALTAGQTAALRALARARGRTLRTVLLAAWSRAVSRLLGPLPVCVPVAGRDDPRLLPVVGRFVNLAVVPSQSAPDFAGLLDRTHHAALAAYRAQRSLPVHALEGERAFPVLFDLDEAPAAAPGGAGLRVADHPREHWSDFGLALLAHPAADRLELVMTHDPDLHPPATADGLRAAVLDAVDSAAAVTT